MDHHVAIHAELTNKFGELPKEHIQAHASDLMDLALKLNHQVDEDKDYTATALQILEIAVLISRHVNEDHTLTPGADTDDSGHEVTSEEVRGATLEFENIGTVEVAKLHYAVLHNDAKIPPNMYTSIALGEDFAPVETFETILEAIGYADKNDYNRVVRVDWENSKAKLAFLRETVID